MSKNNIQLLFEYVSQWFYVSQSISWCKRCTRDYKNVTWSNWTKSFEDGIALLAILHHHDPSLVPDINELVPGQNVDANLTRAWTLAEKHYDIPQLLELIGIV